MSDTVSTAPLDAVHHVTINVADIPQSVRWYESSFRCELVHQEPRYAILRFANVLLTLALPSAEPPHIAFLRPDAAKFGELRPRVEEIQSTFVADPTGNMVEIGA